MGLLSDAIQAADEYFAPLSKRASAVETARQEAAESLARQSSAYDSDPWTWIEDCVWTKDEADTKRPLKRFPVAGCARCRVYFGAKEGELREATVGPQSDESGHGRPPHVRCPACKGDLAKLAYLENIARRWEKADPPILLVPKSRRMRISWLMVALHTWLAVTHRGAAVFIVSSKEEKSAELVSRCEHILRYVPRVAFRVPGFRVHRRPPRIEFPSLGSQIVGIPEGPDQLRQFTATAIYFDEFGFWKWPRASYAAARPCIEGGGRLTIVSSAAPGFWKSLVSGEVGA